jgi:hypothetical protein
MDVSAAVMVVSDRGRVIATAVLLGVRCDIGRDMKVSRTMIINVSDESHIRPIGCVVRRVPRFDYAMQVERRQHGDAQTDTEVAKNVRQ